MGLWRRGEESEWMKLTHVVIGAAYDVARALGPRFSAAVYRAALKLELERRQVRVTEQPSITVKYLSRVVGEFRPDLLVGDQVLVELESAPMLPRSRLEAALRVLDATRVPGGVLLNFGAKKLEYRRLRRGF